MHFVKKNYIFAFPLRSREAWIIKVNNGNYSIVKIPKTHF